MPVLGGRVTSNTVTSKSHYRDKVVPDLCSITREPCDSEGDCRFCSFVIFKKLIRDEDNPIVSWVISWEQDVVCGVCKGEGKKPGKEKEGFPVQVCPKCKGTGMVEVTKREVIQTKRSPSISK